LRKSGFPLGTVVPSPHILLIEDHLMVQEFFSQVLAGDYGESAIVTCCTLAEARAALAARAPDLVIVDWQLPDGRGLDLVREYKPRLPATRWLTVSAIEQERIVQEAVDLGVNGFVMKRSSTTVLREAVREVLGGASYYCPVSTKLLIARLAPKSDASLTPREHEVLQRFARGENPKTIADALGTSVKTAQNHLAALKEKLGLREPADLVRYAIKQGYVDAP